MQTAINSLEQDLKHIAADIREREEVLRECERGTAELRAELSHARIRLADKQQAIEILRAVSGFGQKSNVDVTSRAEMDEVAQNAGRTAENYAAHKSAETAYETFQSPDCNYRAFRGSGNFVRDVEGGQGIALGHPDNREGSLKSAEHYVRSPYADDTPAPRKATTQERAPGFGGL